MAGIGGAGGIDTARAATVGSAGTVSRSLEGCRLQRRSDRRWIRDLFPALEVGLQLVAVDHLGGDQQGRETVQQLSVLGEDLLRADVGLIQESPDLLVDQLRGVRAHFRHRARHPRVRVVPAERDGSDRFAHAELRHHRTGEVGGFLEVVLRAGGDHPVEVDLFRGLSAHREGHLVLQLRLRHDVAVFEWPRHRDAESSGTARDDRHPVEGIDLLAIERDERVPHLVHRHPFLLTVGDHPRFPFEARRGAVDGLLELLHRHRVLLPAGGEQGGLVHDVLEVRSGESWRPGRDRLEIDAGIQCHTSRVDPKDLLTPVQVRQVDDDLPVEPPRADQGRVKHVRAVGRGHDDHALGGVEAVHLDEELVQRLLALVVPAEAAAHGPRAALPDRVDLVEEDQRRRLLLRLLEELAHASSAQPHEHLHELRSRHEEERDVRFARDGSCEQGLPAAGGPEEQHALGDPAAEPLVLLRVLQEVDDLAELFLRLVDARDVREGGLHLLAVVDLHLVAPEIERRGGAAADPPEEEVVETSEQGDEQDGLHDETREGVRLRPGHLVPLCGELVDQSGRVVTRRDGREPRLGPVLRADHALDGGGRDRDVLGLHEFAVVDGALELRERHWFNR